MKILKKSLLVLASFLMVFAFGCSGSGNTSAQVQEGVKFTLVDVLKTENKKQNTVFYYFLASIDNESEADYHMSNLHYVMTDVSNQTSTGIHPIDQFQTTITDTLRPDMSTFVYGYIGIPASKYDEMGLYLPGQDQFIPFDSVRIRTIDDENIVNSEEKAFTIYDDGYFEFDVDGTNLAYHYENGKSRVDGLSITYRNKTDSRLVVPFLTPICTIDGLNIEGLPDKDKLLAMSQEEIEKQDFHSNGLEARTETFTGETLGYQLFYLPPQQEVTCQISFDFGAQIPDFSAAQHNSITININSPALGYSQTMKVSY